MEMLLWQKELRCFFFTSGGMTWSALLKNENAQNAALWYLDCHHAVANFLIPGQLSEK